MAQICSGTMTAVWRDDFGSGIPQLSPTGSANITAGYTYEEFGVHPGHYSLVNKFDYFGSWHFIPEDHTPLDSGGYFLVIDGNSSAPIFYETIVTNVCPLTQYSFSTFAMNVDLPAFPSDQTFTFIISDTSGNQLFTWDSPPISTNDAPLWVPMGFSFNSGNHTALKLQARFNQTGYDDFAFDDFQFSICGPTLSITSPVASNSCADSIPLFTLLGAGYTHPVYQWQKKDSSGTFVNIPGATGVNYTDQLPADTNVYQVVVGDGSLACPIKENKKINVRATKRSTVARTICSGSNVEGYTSTGNYIDTFTAANGCDSIRTLNLIVNNCTTSVGCNNWLHIPTYNTTDYVALGDLDMTGDKITVEASFAADTNYFIPSTISYDLVSKHTDPSDCNYLLRPVTAEITTTNGFFQIIACDYKPRKINHAALVYDGTTLKFYRNGFLMGSKPASGNLVTNDLITKIGNYSFGSLNGSLKGYMNEVRIWNIARTQDEIKTYMNASLPNPAAQAGLVAYYTFDNLDNKQGNTAWNGTLHGAATINNTVPDCNFIADTCLSIPVKTGISGIINDYTPVIGFDSCGNKIVVEDGSAFSPGDTVLMIQMKGAIIDSANNSSFGNILDYKNAGNYEFNYVKNKAGNVIELSNVLLRQYDIPNGPVQLVRVPYYQNTLITDTLTCLPWNGKTGGILVFNVKDTIEMDADIDVTGRGFKGAAGININSNITHCGETGYSYPASSVLAALKGESIAIIQPDKSAGRAPVANGGGGGLEHNSGGGGGGNGGTGGLGGYQWESCGNAPFENRGIGGNALTYSNIANKIFMGGGGGAGQTNNPPAGGFAGDGANGGAIVMIKANFIKTNGRHITANGADAIVCNGSLSYCHEAAGGGGGAGTILLDTITALDNVNIQLNGGKGGNMTGDYLGSRLGPGGGGGGGVLWVASNTLPGNFLVAKNGGSNGVCTVAGNDPWGATPGQNGVEKYNLVRIIDTIPYKKAIDSVRIKESLTGCKTISFNGLAYTNNAIIQQWQWDFGDNSFAATQNTTHSYSTNGSYTVKLVVTASNGCKDSIMIQVIVPVCSTNTIKIINDYAAVINIDPCSNQLVVDDASLYNNGDTVVIMQMKGASIDSVNTSSFGTVSNYNNAGTYEFNYVKNKTGNTIELVNTLLRQYDAVAGKVQLIKVPYYQTLTIADTITCLPWNGSKGGVVILNSATDVILNAPVDVSNKGFRGGQIGGGFSCNNLNDWAAPTGNGGTKGEGITEYINGFEAGGARLANGGGGAYAANTGAGGGGNYGAGGLGGFQYNGCASPTQSIGGDAVDYSDLSRVFAGGAGGGSQQDNGQPVSVGGNGGGIVIIKALNLVGNNQQISANGESITTLVRDEGGAGGGAGGSVLLYVDNFSGNLTVDINGGNGSSNENQIYPDRCHGPGGGGGGGYVGFKYGLVPPGISVNADGGLAGLVLNPSSPCFNTTGGAADGAPGGGNFNIVLPEATIPFKKNIDSVKIKDSLTACKKFDFKGMAFTSINPVKSWQWNFGDNTSDTAQNPSHTYTAGGVYTVKLLVTDINGCKDSTEKIINPAGINFDFIFEQDICNPRAVQFTATGDTTATIFWSLGDGTIINNIRNPFHLYADTGYYLVQYSTGSGLCMDTVKKRIYIGYTNSNIILTPDTTICFGTSKLLRSSIDSSLGFCWSPSNYLNNVNLANPTTTPPASVMYTLLAASETNNLVVNGDFSNGNTSFNSGYSFTNGLPLNDGEYTVSNSTLTAGLISACNDHTTAGGNMLIGKNNAIFDTTIWQQTVNVVPNTNYIFSFWIQGVQPLNASTMALSINNNISSGFIANFNTACSWEKHFITWNSGSNTSAKLDIINYRSLSKYFVLDDISFAAYSIKRDTVQISVDTPFINTRQDTAVCKSVAVQLSTTGAVSYTWSPAAGLSNPSIGNPLATPDSTTKYIVTGTNANGCIASDSVTITIKPIPAILKTSDTIVCRNTTVPLFASGGSGYLWSPAASLNNATIPNPVATPTAASTWYVVTVTGSNNCSNKDSVKVSVKPIPTFAVSPAKSVCVKSNTQLNASGGNAYWWSPAAAVSNPNISNPISTAQNSTLYSVIIKDTTCGDTDTLFTNLTVFPLPVVTAAKTNDINCATGSSILSADGAVRYNWAPATSLNDHTIISPVASPAATTVYTVTGTDINGCSATAAVTVAVDFNGKVSYSMPNAFTPNGDGVNDCFRIKYFGQVTELQFFIYNRWGNKVFESSNAGDCWDGNYKGNPAEAGNYVYYIKAKTGCGPVERKGNVLLIR